METSKTGRKQKHFTDPKTGLPVVGLSRRPSDGRWRIIGTQVTFTEPDVQKAIDRFRQLTSNPERQAYDSYADNELMPQLAMLLQRPEAWQIIGNIIREKPKWVAEKTGIEQLGYYRDLKPPTPAPTFQLIADTWTKHNTVLPQERRFVLSAWKDFCDTHGGNDIDDITPESVVKYRDAVYARELSAKTQSHRFARIRRIISFAKDRAIAVDKLASALEYLSLLKPDDTTVSLNPIPIDPADWHKLLDASEGDDRAMILLMLNCALYLQEVVDLEWADIIDGCLIAHRKKKGKIVRVAVLWDETLEALKAVRRKGERIFYSDQGAPLTVSGAGKRWRKLRTAAKAENVIASQLRDGAYTRAVEANVNQQLCQLLVGHRSGIADHYVKRSPQMVKPACDAIYEGYMRKKPK